jgi:YD repeat-containing protein
VDVWKIHKQRIDRREIGVFLAAWGYYDYLSVGSPSKGAHAFQTLCKLDASGNRTGEEFHYAYDQQGRLFEAAFAQTPSNLTPDASGCGDGRRQ